MVTKEQFLSNKKRYQPITLPQKFSDEEMARDWTLSEIDIGEINKYREEYRLFVAVQLCAVRLHGRFLSDVNDLSLRIISYLNNQLSLPPSLTIRTPERKATYTTYRKNILTHLGFQKFTESAQQNLQIWLEEQARQGILPKDLFHQAEKYLLAKRTLLPGPSVLERLVIRVCSEVHAQIFESIYRRLSPDLQSAIDRLLTVPERGQHSLFAQLKAYPPEAKISSLRVYLQRYQTLKASGIDAIEEQLAEPAFQDYLFNMTKKYSAKEIKRLNKHKRYAMMISFLLETRKVLLDHLVKMHDQYMMEISRRSKNSYEKKHRQLRRRQKRAVDTVLSTSGILLDWPDDKPLLKHDLWQHTSEMEFRSSLDDLRIFKRMQERGYGDLLLAKYPSLRKYFADFIHLPFAAEHGSDPLLRSIRLVRQLDAGEIKKLPLDTPTTFVPKELRRALKDDAGSINRNAWEMGLALAIKDALRSGDLYLPQSKQHVSFWDLMLSNSRWQELKEDAFSELKIPEQHEAKTQLSDLFHENVITARKQFGRDNFAKILNGRLKLKRDDKLAVPDSVTRLQKVIDTSMPSIRIENLLMAVDEHTNFSRHFIPIQGHRSRPAHFYKALMAGLISQATNLGVVAMSASVKDISVDMLRHILHFFVREETLKAASAEIVNRHHQLPLSAVYGSGKMSSSDAQRFGIHASSLLASYYPRYFGYYQRAIGIHTHVSDQYSVFSTKVISCSPREALYVLDGLLENNTILKPQKHTTDTHGYTEINFAAFAMLGRRFSPRIRGIQKQRIYRLDQNKDYGALTPLVKPRDRAIHLDWVTDQWDRMGHFYASLECGHTTASTGLKRLVGYSGKNRFYRANRELGRVFKTEHILRVMSDPLARQQMRRGLLKSEEMNALARQVAYGKQGTLTTRELEEQKNTSSCLTLIMACVIYWQAKEINRVILECDPEGNGIDLSLLEHISPIGWDNVLFYGEYVLNRSLVKEQNVIP